MNREEILLKSRNENTDEGLIAAENQGRKIGIAVFSCIFGFIALFDFFNGQSNPEVYSLYWAFLAAEAYPKYRFTAKLRYLVVVIAGLLTCVLCIGSYVLKILR